MLAITVEFGLTDEGGLEEVEDVGRRFDMNLLIGFEADLQINRFKGC